jgi:hypothetical protein
MAVSWQFVWAPAEFMPSAITLLREQVLDFGYIQEHGDGYIPRLYATPFNFQGFVGAHEAVRYQLQIEAAILHHLFTLSKWLGMGSGITYLLR